MEKWDFIVMFTIGKGPKPAILSSSPARYASPPKDSAFRLISGLGGLIAKHSLYLLSSDSSFDQITTRTPNRLKSSFWHCTLS